MSQSLSTVQGLADTDVVIDEEAGVLPLPQSPAPDGGRRWFQVVFKPRVILRSMPQVESTGVATASTGEVLEAEEVKEGWVKLTDREAVRRGAVHADEAWVLVDGRARGLGALLRPCLPRWFFVLFKPRIALFGFPEQGGSGTAPVVGTAGAGEAFEVVEAVGSWVRLTDAEALRRGVPEDSKAWALVDGHSRGLGELLAPCFRPPEEVLQRWDPEEQLAKAQKEAEDQEEDEQLQLSVPPDMLFSFEEVFQQEEFALEPFFGHQDPHGEDEGGLALQTYGGMHWGPGYSAAADSALVPLELVVTAANEAADVPDPAWPVPEPQFL
mmetsp:Transcript_35626/g.111175  ORF Transcript_35626/g.111175 Transcript_35626/m.111175 type:complete len:326 (+) Transcript_35626:31-1008(+)